MSELHDKIKARIRKLLAVARDPAAAEGEARNALTFATRLMIEHNLAESDLGFDAAASSAGYASADVPSLSKRTIIWEQVLSSLSSKAIGPVKAVATWGNGARAFSFYGPGEMPAIAAELFDSLRGVIVRSSIYGGVVVGPGREYAEGFVVGLQHTLKAETMPAVVETSIAVRVESIAKWVETQFESMGSESRVTPRRRGAEFFAGKRDGEAHGVRQPHEQVAQA